MPFRKRCVSRVQNATYSKLLKAKSHLQSLSSSGPCSVYACGQRPGWEVCHRKTSFISCLDVCFATKKRGHLHHTNMSSVWLSPPVTKDCYLRECHYLYANLLKTSRLTAFSRHCSSSSSVLRGSADISENGGLRRSIKRTSKPL